VSLIRQAWDWLLQGDQVGATKATPPLTPVAGSWGSTAWIIRESYTGAWQNNDALAVDSVILNPTVYACATMIAQDLAKLHLALVQQTGDGVWSETTSPAFSPVLSKPNRYQTIAAFVKQWILSKLLHGNTYVLKQRDGRGVVTALYVLDALRVHVLVAPD